MEDGWIGIDYNGQERVNFATMEWKFVGDLDGDDERTLKRVSAVEWLISSEDGTYWGSYGGVDETKVLESIYQSWLENKHKIEIKAVGVDIRPASLQQIKEIMNKKPVITGFGDYCIMRWSDHARMAEDGTFSKDGNIHAMLEREADLLCMAKNELAGEELYTVALSWN